MKHIILSCAIFVQIYAVLQAQNIECVGNTITITVGGFTDGNIQWQFSNNNQDWADLTGATGTTLTHNVIETGFFRAKVNYGRCIFFGDTEYIIAHQGPSIANAGADQNIITEDTIVTLEANTPTFGIGKWSIVSSGKGSFANESNPVTTFTGRKYTAYTLRWTITTDCKASTDNVLIFFNDPFNTLSDADGNNYTSVYIGSQKWMVQNLKTTKYSDGTDIPLVSEQGEWSALSTPGYCWYNNDETNNKDTNGALYNWYTVNTRKLCPAGWHVPDDDEWKTLEKNLGMLQSSADATGWRGTDQGTQLKSSNGWNSNGNGTNTQEFSALPSGARIDNGIFAEIGNIGLWWSSSESGGLVFRRQLSYNNNLVYRGLQSKRDGGSVRCVKDN